MASPDVSSSFRGHFSNLLGATMLDDNLRLISDFLYAHSQATSTSSTGAIELEGKLGLLFSKKKDARIHLDGVRGLVCLAADEVDASFAAEVDANMFRHINEDLLQRRYQEDQQKAAQEGRKPLWTYEHKHTVDRLDHARTRESHREARASASRHGACESRSLAHPLSLLPLWLCAPGSTPSATIVFASRTTPTARSPSASSKRSCSTSTSGQANSERWLAKTIPGGRMLRHLAAFLAVSR